MRCSGCRRLPDGISTRVVPHPNVTAVDYNTGRMRWQVKTSAVGRASGPREFERLHNVEQLHDIVRQRLTDVRSRGPFGVPLHGDSWFNSGDPGRSEIPLS